MFARLIRPTFIRFTDLVQSAMSPDLILVHGMHPTGLIYLIFRRKLCYGVPCNFQIEPMKQYQNRLNLNYNLHLFEVI